MKALTALTLGKKAAPVSRMTPIPTPAAPQSDVLFEMFHGVLGGVHLGRLLRGRDAGRLVALRKLLGEPSQELAVAVDLARSIAHPRLAKVLGIIEEPGATYLVSEYIPGVTLFELGRTASNRQLPVSPQVAVRILLDALTAADAAQQLLAQTVGALAVRCIYPESIWIAEFGETFLSEVLVAPLLPRSGKGHDPVLSATKTGAADVRAAALELIRMTCAGLSADDPTSTDISGLPEELQDVLLRALGHGSLVGYASTAEFGAALSGFDETWIASDAVVGQELQRLMGTVLTVRRQKLEMLERHAVPDHSEDQGDETKFFRVAVKTEQRDTTRPPPDGAKDQTALGTRTPLPTPDEALTPFPTPEALDEPTLLFRREDGSARTDWFGAPSAPDEPASAAKPSVVVSSAETSVEAPSSRNEATQLSLARRSEQARGGVVAKSRGRALLLYALGLLVMIAGARLLSVAHRDHSSLGAAWESDASALRKTLSELAH